MSLSFKGMGSIKDVQKAQARKEKQDEEDNEWLIVFPPGQLRFCEWHFAQGSWYSPNRDASHGWHLHIITNGDIGGYSIVSDVIYTHENNYRHHGNIHLNFDFNWTGSDPNAAWNPGETERSNPGVIKLTLLTNVNMDETQRVHLETFLAIAQVVSRKQFVEY